MIKKNIKLSIVFVVLAISGNSLRKYKIYLHSCCSEFKKSLQNKKIIFVEHSYLTIKVLLSELTIESVIGKNSKNFVYPLITS